MAWTGLQLSESMILVTAAGRITVSVALLFSCGGGSKEIYFWDCGGNLLGPTKIFSMHFNDMASLAFALIFTGSSYLFIFVIPLYLLCLYFDIRGLYSHFHLPT